MCFAQYYSVDQLIEIRFTLSKLARIQINDSDSILNVLKLFNLYREFVNSGKGIDIEFPNFKLNFDSEDNDKI